MVYNIALNHVVINGPELDHSILFRSSEEQSIEFITINTIDASRETI